MHCTLHCPQRVGIREQRIINSKCGLLLLLLLHVASCVALFNVSIEKFAIFQGFLQTNSQLPGDACDVCLLLYSIIIVCVCVFYMWVSVCVYCVCVDCAAVCSGAWNLCNLFFFSQAESLSACPCHRYCLNGICVCVCVCMWSVCVCGVCVWGCLNCLLPESYLALAKRPRQSQRGKNKRPTSKTNFCTHSWIHAMVCVRVRVYVCLCAILFLCLCVSLCWLVCVRICVFTSQWRHRISSATRFAQKKNTKLGNLNHKCRVRVCVCEYEWKCVCFLAGHAYYHTLIRLVAQVAA